MSRLRAKVNTKGAERRFEQTARDLQSELNEIVKEVGEDAELIFAAHALRDTGRMSRGVRSTPQGSTALVQVHAEDPKTGFDYVAVTRFGHRVDRIHPKHAPRDGRYLAPIPGVGPRWVRKRAALRTPFGYRASVRGFKPKGDWADRARPQIEQNASQMLTRFGGRVTARLS